LYIAKQDSQTQWPLVADDDELLDSENGAFLSDGFFKSALL